LREFSGTFETSQISLIRMKNQSIIHDKMCVILKTEISGVLIEFFDLN